LKVATPFLKGKRDLTLFIFSVLVAYVW
jgi:hypothetical protein